MIATLTCSRNRTAPKLKAPHFRFLTWVAYVRHYLPKLDEIAKRSCPLRECKEPFGTASEMHKHVYRCEYLAKGSYECSGCGKHERVSKFNGNGCPDLRRFPSVTNSLRRAKELFSSHGSKVRDSIHESMRRQDATQEWVESPTPDHSGKLSELADGTSPCPIVPEMDTDWRSSPHDFLPEIHSQEIYGHEMPAEFAVQRSYWSSSMLQPQEAVLELSAGDDSASSFPTELSTGFDYEGSNQRSPQRSNERTEAQLNLHDISALGYGYGARFQRDSSQPAQYQPYRPAEYGGTSHDNVTQHDAQSPIVSPLSEHEYPTGLTILPPSSRTDTNVSALSMSSVPSLDTWNTSIDSLGSRGGQSDKPPAPFFDDSELFEEPESMDDSFEWPVQTSSFSNAASFGKLFLESPSNLTKQPPLSNHYDYYS